MGGGKIRVSPRKPSSADFSWQDKPRPVYSGLPWRTKMLVKPFSAGVSRERPQSRISPRGTSVCTGTLTRCTETLAYRRQRVCAGHTDRSLTTLIFHRMHLKYIASRIWMVEREILLNVSDLYCAFSNCKRLVQYGTIAHSIVTNLYNYIFSSRKMMC